MMPNHADFSHLLFPREWGTPKFQLGQTVTVDDEIGTVVGATYDGFLTLNRGLDTHKPGWWFMVSVWTEVNGKILKNVCGYHQDVIQPVLAPAVDEIQHQHSGMAPINTFYIPSPLA